MPRAENNLVDLIILAHMNKATPGGTGKSGGKPGTSSKMQLMQTGLITARNGERLCVCSRAGARGGGCGNGKGVEVAYARTRMI